MIDQPILQKRFSLMPAWGFVPAGSDHALKRLIRAMIAQAGKDARRGDTEALEWLTGEDCALYCEFAGVNFIAVRNWAFMAATIGEQAEVT